MEIENSVVSKADITLSQALQLFPSQSDNIVLLGKNCGMRWW